MKELGQFWWSFVGYPSVRQKSRTLAHDYIHANFRMQLGHQLRRAMSKLFREWNRQCQHLVITTLIRLPGWGDSNEYPKQWWRGDSSEYPQHTCLCRTEEKYPLIIIKYSHYLSRLMTKPSSWLSAQQGLRSAWASESSLYAQWVVKDPSFLHADSEDSDQTRRMPRLIWVFAGRTVILLILTWGGSAVSLILLYQSSFNVPLYLTFSTK